MYRTTDGPWGGGNSFLRALKKHWQLSGVEVTDKLDANLDGVLINSSNSGASSGRPLSPKSVVRMVNSGHTSLWAQWLRPSQWSKTGNRPAFVHRLDGIYRLYGREANDPGDIAQLGINPNMDWTIYQSEFCRQSFLKESADVSRSTVILNGVDLDHFVPLDPPPKMAPFKIIAVSWSPNPNKGAPDLVRAAQIPGVEATFVGNWPQGLDSGNVKVIPPQPHDVLAKMLADRHALFHMALNDPCSNAVMEGIASGLPVIYHPSGGTPEIVEKCGLPGSDDLQQAITQLRDRYDDFRTKTLERREQLSVELAAAKYLDVFRKIGKIRVP